MTTRDRTSAGGGTTGDASWAERFPAFVPLFGEMESPIAVVVLLARLL